MKRNHLCSLLVPLVVGISAVAAHANSRGPRGPKVPERPFSFVVRLKPSSPLVDLATAKGKLVSKDNKGRVNFHASITVPMPSASLEIADSAESNSITIEVSKKESISSTCTLVVPADAHRGSGSAKFQVKGKRASKNGADTFTIGSCTTGIPSLSKGDTVQAYGTVNGEKLYFLRGFVFAK